MYKRICNSTGTTPFVLSHIITEPVVHVYTPTFLFSFKGLGVYKIAKKVFTTVHPNNSGHLDLSGTDHVAPPTRLRGPHHNLLGAQLEAGAELPRGFWGFAVSLTPCPIQAVRFLCA